MPAVRFQSDGVKAARTPDPYNALILIIPFGRINQSHSNDGRNSPHLHWQQLFRLKPQFLDLNHRNIEFHRIVGKLNKTVISIEACRALTDGINHHRHRR
jgi:hypothetical protein